MAPEFYISGRSFKEVDELLEQEAEIVLISTEGTAFSLDKEPVILSEDRKLVISNEGLRLLREDYGIEIEHER